MMLPRKVQNASTKQADQELLDLLPHVEGPDEVRARLEEILKALPVLEGRRETIAKEAEYLRFHDGIMSLNELPRVNSTTTKQAEQELQKLLKLLKPLVHHIDGMHKTALDAMEEEEGLPDKFVRMNTLIKMGDAAWRGAKRLRDQSEVKMTERPWRKNQRADAITPAAMKVFERLTGKRAALSVREGVARGRFHGFLKDIFKLYGINASVEVKARAAIAEARARAIMEGRPQK